MTTKSNPTRAGKSWQRVEVRSAEDGAQAIWLALGSTVRDPSLIAKLPFAQFSLSLCRGHASPERKAGGDSCLFPFMAQLIRTTAEG